MGGGRRNELLLTDLKIGNADRFLNIRQPENQETFQKYTVIPL